MAITPSFFPTYFANKNVGQVFKQSTPYFRAILNTIGRVKGLKHTPQPLKLYWLRGLPSMEKARDLRPKNARPVRDPVR